METGSKEEEGVLPENVAAAQEKKEYVLSMKHLALYLICPFLFRVAAF